MTGSLILGGKVSFLATSQKLFDIWIKEMISYESKHIWALFQNFTSLMYLKIHMLFPKTLPQYAEIAQKLGVN